MRRPWQVWITFTFFLAVVLSAMAWITVTVIRLESSEAEARSEKARIEAAAQDRELQAAADLRRQELLEERVRLALWRLDSALVQLIATEIARPYFVYSAFPSAFSSAAGPNFGPSDAQVNGQAAGQAEESLAVSAEVTQVEPQLLPEAPMQRQEELYESDIVAQQRDAAQQSAAPQQARQQADFPQSTPTTLNRPSLSASLAENPPEVLLYFQFDADGQIRSPQLPVGQTGMSDGDNRAAPALPDTATARLARLKAILNREALAAALPRADLAATMLIPLADMPSKGVSPTKQIKGQDAADNQAPRNQYAGGKNLYNRNGDYVGSQSQREWSQQERNVRQMAVQQVLAGNTTTNNELYNYLPLATMVGVRQGLVRALWFEDALILARRVTIDGADRFQGCWLDWPAVRRSLLEQIGDLLPEADLVAAPTVQDDDLWRTLTAAPIMLVPGAIPAEFLQSAGLMPLHAAAPNEMPDLFSSLPLGLTLLIAWGCVILAVAAVALLLWGAVSLSERRAAFVSAVTHELRTPLTTFRLYTEMLGRGMVTDEAKRASYINTLEVEADRLSHLVENVLCYARIERKPDVHRVQNVTLGEMIASTRDRLSARAEQSAMQLVIEQDTQCDAQHGGDAAQIVAQADPAAVEQILFNLVDNAAKYAASAKDRRIHIQAGRNGRRAMLRVCDHGPGVRPEETRRLFQPFCKAKADSSHTTPGVGLGLTLSRRLARNMGGDLRAIPQSADGACFELVLPLGRGEGSRS